jgi:hypothetical protein
MHLSALLDAENVRENILNLQITIALRVVCKSLGISFRNIALKRIIYLDSAGLSNHVTMYQ